MEAPPTRTFALIAMAALILVFAPATAAGDGQAVPQNHEQDCIREANQTVYRWVNKEIILPKPVAPNLPVTTLSWALFFNDANHGTAEDAAKGPINGLDAYVIDLGCEVDDFFYCLTGFDANTNAYDLQVTFRDESFQTIAGPINPSDSPDVCGDDTNTISELLPNDTRFLEIVTVDGVPGACGCLDDDTFLPATVQITLELTR